MLTRRDLLRSAFIASATFFLGAPDASADPNAGREDSLIQLASKIETTVSKFVARYKLPGCAVVITNPRGQTIYSRGFGFADAESKKEFTPDTLCQVASVSKSVTGILAAQLIADGKLALNQKVFPTLIENNILRAEEINDPKVLDITVEHLLQQTSGMGNKNTVWATKEIIERNKISFVNGRLTPINYLALCLGQGLEGKPGDKYRYCNTNFVALNVLISATFQKSVLDVANERIFHPIGVRIKNFSSHISDKDENEAVCYDLGPTFGPSALQENWGQRTSSSYGFIDYTPMELWCLSANGLRDFILNVSGATSNTVITDEARAVIGKVPNYDLGKDVNGTPAYWYQSAGTWVTWPSHHIGEGAAILNFSGNSNGALAAYKGLPDRSYIFLVGNGNILGHPGMSDELMDDLVRAISQ